MQKIKTMNLLNGWSFDHYGPFHESPDGYKYLIVATENISHYVIIRAVKSTGVENTAKMILEDVILKFRLPKYLTSDRGTAYTANIIEKLNELMQVEHRYTSSYHLHSGSLADEILWREVICVYQEGARQLVTLFSVLCVCV